MGRDIKAGESPKNATIAVRLSVEDRKYLKSFGTLSDGVRELIQMHRTTDPETAFFNLMYLPPDSVARKRYCALLRRFIPTPSHPSAKLKELDGITSQLFSSGYLVVDPTSGYRPTIRLKKTITKERFDKTFEEYGDFLRLNGNFPDVFQFPPAQEPV